MKKTLALIFLLALWINWAAHAEIAVPTLSHRVTDLTSTLSVEQEKTLEARLARLEAEKGAQLMVLIIPSTQPETIEQFGIRVFDAWKIGCKKVDDGVLLLVAKDDRKMRIEVGYGLEGALNDATAKRIIAETITPYFKRNELFPGIDAGVLAIVQAIKGEALPPTATANNGWLSPASLFIFMIAVMILTLLFTVKWMTKRIKNLKNMPNSGGWNNNSENNTSGESSGSSSGSSGGSDSASGGGGSSGGGGASGSW